MNATVTARRAAACHSCRKLLLRSFIASLGRPAFNHQRAYTSTDTAPPEASLGHGFGSASGGQNHELINSAPLKQEQKPHTPWYLQKQPELPEQNKALVSARQHLPDLPSHPPDLLQPLLEYVSVSLGMDDLSLLDLRSMEPPPALGANLLMIVGTARSEKHLHVSADRLCRWLRSDHDLMPYADGLLGRQELKVKLRRLAKKKKMMSHVKASFTQSDSLGPTDDGIRTGWVCVNVGRVEGGELPKSDEQLEREANIVGFGTGIRGSSMVVQLMTEEKRGELELERLWASAIKKSRRDQDAIRNDLEEGSVLARSAVEVELASKQETEADVLSNNQTKRQAEDAEQEKASPIPQLASFTPFFVKDEGLNSGRQSHKLG